MKRYFQRICRVLAGLVVLLVAAVMISCFHHAAVIRRLEAGVQRNIEINYVTRGPMAGFDRWFRSLLAPVWTWWWSSRILPPRHVRASQGHKVDEDFLDLRLVSAIFGRVDEVDIYYFERLTPEFETAIKGLNGVRKVEVYENDFFGYLDEKDEKVREAAGKKDGIRIVTAVAAIPSVEEVKLGDCWLSDEALAKLKGHPKIRVLKLETEREITDASIATIESLPALRELEIFSYAFTPKAVLGLKQRRPNLIIHYSPTDYWEDHPDEIPADGFPYDETFFATENPANLAPKPAIIPAVR